MLLESWCSYASSNRFRSSQRAIILKLDADKPQWAKHARLQSNKVWDVEGPRPKPTEQSLMVRVFESHTRVWVWWFAEGRPAHCMCVHVILVGGIVGLRNTEALAPLYVTNELHTAP